MSLSGRHAPRHRPPEATRAALLQAAGEVFATTGFRAATVRAICRRAGANIAAVNYHFGNKEQLYLEVLRHSCRMVPPPARPASTRRRPREQLHTFVHDFLTRLLNPGPDGWQDKLIAMEMIEPTHGLDTMVEERIRPMADYVRQLVRQILGRGAEPETVRLCGCSIVSQCLFYEHCRAVICRLVPEQKYDAPAIERLAEHITRFSLAAINHYARQTQGRRS